MAEEEVVIEEEVVSISDDSQGPLVSLDGRSLASVVISDESEEEEEIVVEEEEIVVEGEEEVVVEEEVVEEEEVEEEVIEEEVADPSHHLSTVGSTTMHTTSIDSFGVHEVEVKPQSTSTIGASTIESFGQTGEDEREELVVGLDDEVDDSWDPGRTRRSPNIPISPKNSTDDHYFHNDASSDSHSWMPLQKPSYDPSEGVTPRISHRKAEGIHLEDAINSIDGGPFSPTLSKASYDTTINSPSNDSTHSESWRHPSHDQNGNTNDELHKIEKESSESDDSSLIRRQKQVQFAGLPEHPPELTKPTNTHLPVVEENGQKDSSDSYETDSSAEASSVYETDSEASEVIAGVSMTSSGRNRIVNYRPSETGTTPVSSPLSSPADRPVSPVNLSATSDVESQPQSDYFAPASETRPKESRLFKARVIILAILLLVGTAICLYFFYEFTKDEHRDRLIFTKVPTRSPTLRPVTRPTATPMSPTALPTRAPFEPTSSPVPTETPEPTFQNSSTFSPTEIQPQNNDECIDAIGPLTIGSSIRGTTESATEDEVDSCDNTSNNGLPGVWYYVLGNGGEMQAHTCKNTDIDSKISIYGGPCSNPQCLEVSDNFCGQQSAVSWDSEFQKPYYILVQGRSQQRAMGHFELSIEARYNDECSNAITLEASPDAANAPTIEGQTLEANPNSFVCNGLENESPSVFYVIRGTGEELAVAFQTDFNSRISILVGDCSNLSCVAQSREGETQISWASIQDMEYYVLWHGETSSDVGNFAFQVRSVDVVTQGRAPW